MFKKFNYVTIDVDANEYRVTWVVRVESEDGTLLERRSFSTPKEANDFADYIRYA